MSRLLLLRHGETQWNRENRFQGQADVPLSDLGIAQAREAAEGMARLRPDVIVTSDKQRSLVTAEIIGEVTGVDVRADERLREIDCGSWSGKTWREIITNHPEVAHLKMAGVDFRRSPEGETESEVADRVAPALAELFDEFPDKTVLVVGHGLAHRVGIARVLGWPDSLAWTLGTMWNCHYADLRRKNCLNRLIVHNASAALAGRGPDVQPVE